LERRVKSEEGRLGKESGRLPEKFRDDWAIGHAGAKAGGTGGTAKALAMAVKRIGNRRRIPSFRQIFVLVLSRVSLRSAVVPVERCEATAEASALS